MSVSRRRVLASLGAGALGAGAVAACTPLRRGGSATSTPAAGSTPAAPTAPLVIGGIGSAFGAPGQVEHPIALAVQEAVDRINAIDGGLFGRDIELAGRRTVDSPAGDVVGAVDELAAQGVQVLISSLEDAQLIAALPAIVSHGMAVLCPWSSSSDVRSAGVASGLLFRLVPPDALLAARHVEASFANPPEGARAGTIAYAAPDTTAGSSLLDAIGLQLAPRGGEMLLSRLYPPDEELDVAALAGEILASPPALLVLAGGAESGALASAVHQQSLDASGRPTVVVPARLGPAAAIGYADAGLPEGSLEHAEGEEPGGPMGVLGFDDIMLNLDPGLGTAGYAYAQQAYDAVVIACLAARSAMSVEGRSIAARVRQVLSGTSACSDLGTCEQLLRDAEAAGEDGSIAYSGMSGPLALDAAGDLSAGEQRRITWADDGSRAVQEQIVRIGGDG